MYEGSIGAACLLMLGAGRKPVEVKPDPPDGVLLLFTQGDRREGEFLDVSVSPERVRFQLVVMRDGKIEKSSVVDYVRAEES